MARGLYVYLNDNPNFSEAEINSIISTVEPPEGWDRNKAGIDLYAANAYDPHDDIFEYFANLSNYLYENDIDRPMEAKFSWSTGDLEVYTVSKDAIVYARNDGFEYGEPAVPSEDMTGFRPDDYVMIPYSEPVNSVIFSRKDELERSMQETAMVDAKLRFDYETLCRKNTDDLDVEDRTALLKDMVELKKNLIDAEDYFTQTFNKTHDEYNEYVSAARECIGEDYRYTDDRLFEDLGQTVEGAEDSEPSTESDNVLE